jgi:AhpD family alkylhydroperoxidase
MGNETLLDRIRAERGYLHPSREIIYERDPKYLELYHQLFTHVITTNRLLPLKVKEMIILAINAVNNYEEGLRVHIKAAMDAGASAGEIFEAIETASLPGGIHTMTYSLPIFKQVCGGT